MRVIPRLITLCAICLTAPLAARAADPGPIQAKWKPQEVRYSYLGYTTAYDCDAVESKIKRILEKAGAHPETSVRASSCFGDRPSSNLFVTITTATPVPASEETSTLGKSEQELLERMGAKNAVNKEEFAAAWQTIDLGRDRRLDLEPGDCELMRGLSEQVFPKLGIKVLSRHVQCSPRDVPMQTPDLKVSALMRAPSADEPKQKT